MKNTFRIKKMSILKQIKLQPKMTLIEQKRLTSKFTEEEREDFFLLKSFNKKFNENGN